MARTGSKVEKRESARSETRERRSKVRRREPERGGGGKMWGWKKVSKRSRCHWKRRHCLLPLRVSDCGGGLCLVDMVFER